MIDSKEAVIDVLSKLSKKDKAVIKPQDELVADLGIDSPKQLQLLTELEEKFKLEISDEDAAKINTVNDVVLYINSHK